MRNFASFAFARALGVKMDAEQIARALGGKRSGRQWLCRCPAHDDNSPSLLIFDGHTNVQFRCQAGCDPLDVIAALRKRGILGNGDQVQNASFSRRTDDRVAAAANLRRALNIWDEGIDPRSTLGEMYLKGRGLLLPPKVCTSVVRFHPHCPRKLEKVPALIVLMRDIATNQPRAIQRIFINPRTAKKDKCPASPNGSMMLAPAGAAAMKLTSQFDTFWDDLSFCPRLHVAEGFETALSLQNQGIRANLGSGRCRSHSTIPRTFRGWRTSYLR